MFKTFKWLWKMAYNRSQDNALFEITSMAQYHRQQSEIQAMRDKYEPKKYRPDIEFDMRHFMKPELTPDQHMAIADALYQLADRIQPPEEIQQQISIDPGMPIPPELIK